MSSLIQPYHVGVVLQALKRDYRNTWASLIGIDLIVNLFVRATEERLQSVQKSLKENFNNHTSFSTIIWNGRVCATLQAL